MNSNSNKQKDILESVTEQIFTTLPSKKTQQTPNKQNQKTQTPQTRSQSWKHTCTNKELLFLIPTLSVW